MFQNTLAVIVLLLVSGVEIASCRKCCQTGYNTYTWCSVYCCTDTSIWLSYDECCSSYSRQVSYNYATSSDCDTWFANNVWAAVLIGIGSLGTFVGIIVCCVCCIKGCAGINNRTGAIIVQPGQQQGQGVITVNNTTSQQGMMMQQQQQPDAYGVPMQPGQAAYPPGTAGPWNVGPTNPPPYTTPGAEKHSSGPSN